MTTNPVTPPFSSVTTSFSSATPTTTSSNSYPSGSVLSRPDIIKYWESGQIVIDSGTEQDFDKNSISNCSVDVTLGENYFSHRNYQTYSSEYPPVLDPSSKKSIESYWGVVKKATLPSSKLQVSEKMRKRKCIVLSPGETIIAHTQEFIGSNCEYITTMLKCRSSMTRLGIDTHKGGGWGDINYFSRWTMSLTNFTDRIVVLPVGIRIAQIVFLLTSSPGPKYEGKYQKGYDLSQIKQEWHPEMILPRCYKDFQT